MSIPKFRNCFHYSAGEMAKSLESESNQDKGHTDLNLIFHNVDLSELQLWKYDTEDILLVSHR